MRQAKINSKQSPILRKKTNDSLVRLSKRMSELSICSRREADEYISQGMVKVNGEIINELGTKIHPDDKIELLKAARSQQSQKLSIVLHKPVGYVSHKTEDDYPTATSLLKNSSQSDFSPFGPKLNRDNTYGLAPVGRLDIDSRGLMLFTQDGRLAKYVIGEDSDVEKEYEVTVDSKMNLTQIQKLKFGLELDGKLLKRAKVSPINDHSFRMTLTEGRKRQIRRMCELVGLNVVSLKRTRIGKIHLGHLKEGEWRYLKKNELP